MSIEIVRGASRKPAASDKLIKILSRQTEWSGQVFIGYPIIGTPLGRHHVDALWVSEDKGIVVFDLVEGYEPGGYEDRHDDLVNKIESRLKVYPELVKRRELRIPIHAISFAPAATIRDAGTNDYPLTNSDSIVDGLARFDWPGRDNCVYREALSVIENVSRIRRSKTERRTAREDSRGAKLKRLEDSIATLDSDQNKAFIETVEGVQRIRGLAGSGKTIVLALKAAYLHAQHPEWRVAVTFNTRSLKGLYRDLIRVFHDRQTDEEPNWQNLRIVNSWGAPGDPERDGLYYQFCRVHGTDYLDFRTAKYKFGDHDPFGGACREALDQTTQSRPLYDALLVDEAQDLPPAFLRLCHALLKEPKRLVYAYDELQNLSRESLPPPEEIFSRMSNGEFLFHSKGEDSDDVGHDVVLRKCYRNSGPVLVTAHALGFGIYRSPPEAEGTGLVQMFDHPNLWEEVGYQVQDGALEENVLVTLRRPEDTSPKFLEDHSPVDDLIQFKAFDNEVEQAEWVVKDIRNNLEREELRHDDIIVINPDPVSTRKKVGLIRARLLDVGIRSHLAGIDTDPDVFYKPHADSVTFTGIYRAKGNEAAMVYIINADDCQSAASNLASIRNRLFTAITRSKAWVRVLGVGSRMKELGKEFDTLRAMGFALRFTYPSAEVRAQLRKVHRDMSRVERRRVAGKNRNLNDLVQALERGDVRPDDLDRALLDRLAAFVQRPPR